MAWALLTVMQAATAELVDSGQSALAVKVGEPAPDFDLPELAGGRYSLSECLQRGPVILSFYRGAWCPYCNLEMQAWQQGLPAIEAAGARLLTIAPELPEQAGAIRDKGNLSFPLLYDRDNNVARRYGLVFSLPESLKGVYAAFDIDLQASQGNDRFELPIPATYLIDTDGVVSYAFVDADYSKRCEPRNILDALKPKKGNNP